MNTISHSWQGWRAAFAVLREKSLPVRLGHAEDLEQKLGQHRPYQAIVTLSLTDEAFLRSTTWARW